MCDFLVDEGHVCKEMGLAFGRSPNSFPSQQPRKGEGPQQGHHVALFLPANLLEQFLYIS